MSLVIEINSEVNKENTKNNIDTNNIGNNAGLFSIIFGILLGIVTAIIVLYDYYTYSGNNYITNSTINSTTNNTHIKEELKYLWRPHRAALGMIITFGICSLMCTPFTAIIEVTYYKCKYKKISKDISYKKSIYNSFSSACYCLCRLIVV